MILLEGTTYTVLGHLVVVSGLKDSGWQEKLLLHFLRPLLAEIGRGDDENAPFALGPLLGED